MESLFVESVIIVIVMVYLFLSLEVLGAIFMFVFYEFVDIVDNLECRFEFTEDSHSIS